MIDIILLSILAILIVTLEIIYDLGRWRKGKDDKPMSTYLRALSFIVAALIIQATVKDWGHTLAGVLYLVGSFWLLFDTTINIVRRKVISANFYKLPYDPYYRPFHSLLRLNVGDRYWAYKTLSVKEKIYWTFIKLFHIIFYHGKDKSKWTFDWLFNNTPGIVEVMIKGVAYGLAFYYLNLY